MKELDLLLNERLSDILEDDLVRELKKNSSTCSLSLVSNFCIHSKKLAIPSTTLCCNSFTNSHSSEDSETYARFDWIRFAFIVFTLFDFCLTN